MILYYLLSILCAILASYAQVKLKLFGLKDKPLLRFSNLYDFDLVISVGLFGGSVILSLYVLHFLDFSVFYSFTSLNYLFITLFSHYLLGEDIDLYKVVGNLIIIAGLLVFNS